MCLRLIIKDDGSARLTVVDQLDLQHNSVTASQNVHVVVSLTIMDCAWIIIDNHGLCMSYHA